MYRFCIGMLYMNNILHSLNIEFNAFGWARSMCKYGDFFLYLDLDERLGITSVIGMPGNEVERLEGQDDTNPSYVQYQWNSAGMTFENWQVAHFRILGNDKYIPYGSSVLVLNLIDIGLLLLPFILIPFSLTLFNITYGFKGQQIPSMCSEK